jgi:ABC-type phosphate transport system substrate-binding protein
MASLLKSLAVAGFGLLLSAATTASAADVVVVVSSDSPVDSLSRAELADAYLGRVVRLPSGEPLLPLDQAESSAAYERFYENYLGRTPAQIKAHWSRLIFTGRGRPPPSLRDVETLADRIAATPNAIGYMDAERVGDGLRVVQLE